MNQNEQMFTTAKIIHSALIIGVAVFFAVILFGLPEKEVNDTVDVSQFQLFGYIATMMMAMGIVTGSVLFKRNTSRLKSTTMTAEISREQLLAYQTAMIIRDALMEGPALFSLVTLFLIKGAVGFLDYSLLLVRLPLINVGVFFLLMLYHFPSEEKIKNTFLG